MLNTDYDLLLDSGGRLRLVRGSAAILQQVHAAVDDFDLWLGVNGQIGAGFTNPQIIASRLRRIIMDIPGVIGFSDDFEVSTNTQGKLSIDTSCIILECDQS